MILIATILVVAVAVLGSLTVLPALLSKLGDGVERTIARAYGIEGADDQGVPLVNVLVDRCHAEGGLGRGIAYFLGAALAKGARSISEAAE